jgi:hypothetical protein
MSGYDTNFLPGGTSSHTNGVVKSNLVRGNFGIHEIEEE